MATSGPSDDNRIRPRTRRLDELVVGHDQPWDVIVVGGGGSGAVAAIEAAEQGASVLVLEKTDTLGGSTQESGGSIRLVDDAEGSAEHYLALTQGTTPRDVIDAYINGLLELPAWVEAHGGTLVFADSRAAQPDKLFPVKRFGSAFPLVPRADALGERGRLAPSHPGRILGAALWDFLARNLASLDIPVVTGARVTRLVEDDATRAVTGVEVEGAGPAGPFRLKARGGVILCCGGFSWDSEMTRQYFGHSLPSVSPPGRNTGDGIRLGQQVGADLWHMSAGVATVGYVVPELEAGFFCQMPDYGFVMVDQRGRRYCCETHIENHAAMLQMMKQDALSGEYHRIPSFVVFDDRTRAAGRLATLHAGENKAFPWSADNRAEIERGWFQQADSIAELATVLGLPPETLTRTIEVFNGFARRGEYDDEGRPPEEMRPITEPPFYGAAVHPTLLNTQGGPRRSATAAVLRPDLTPIPGLFSAGELGSIWNRLYPGAGNIGEVLVFGRIAGRSAAVASRLGLAPVAG